MKNTRMKGVSAFSKAVLHLIANDAFIATVIAVTAVAVAVAIGLGASPGLALSVLALGVATAISERKLRDISRD